MRVVFDATSCVRPQRGGITTYGWELVRGCARVEPDNEYVLAVRPHHWAKRALLEGMLPGAKPRLLVDGLHRLTLGAPIDVFHGIGVRLPGWGRFPKVVMIHDLNVFEAPELSKPSWRESRQRRIAETVSRADLLLSYSHQGADAMGEFLSVPREKIRVIPLAVDREQFRAPTADELARVLERFELSDRPYVVHFGTYGPRKNQHGLLEAFARAELPDEWLLVFGGPRDEAAQALRDHGRRLGLPDERLRLPGWIDDADLPGLLAGAAFSACPSLHEGFGLPVLESQACGTPVIASNRGALPETLGDCGLSFDPQDLDAFAAAIRRMAEDEAWRAELSTRGLRRVEQSFTWDGVARATLEAFREAVALVAERRS